MNSFKKGFCSLSFAVLMPLSLFIFPTKSLWASFDTWIFHTCNASVANHPIQRIFWALANIKITDLFGAFFLVGCFVCYILEAQGAERKKRTAQLLYTLLWFEITISLSKQLFITPIIEYFSLYRHGPTLVFPDTAHFLSKLVPWHKIKDCSHSCFPGDHATVVYQWCALFTFFAGKRWGIPTTILSTLFVVPRIISGAHWVSDILVGSLSIATIAVFLATSPSIMDRILPYLYRFLGYKTQTEDTDVCLQTGP